MDRKLIIHQLREQRKTYQEIAVILGISRQRVHQIYKDYANLHSYRKKLTKNRDKEQCVLCGANKDLEIHHINGIKRDNRLENLITLCRKCHLRIERITQREKRLTGKTEQKYSKGKILFY